MKKYTSTLKIAFFTAGTVILFQIISLSVVYQYIRLDLYLSLVAVCFLAAGFCMARLHRQLPTSPEPHEASPASRLNLLTQRELQILALIADGKSNKEIAGVFYVEVSTVKTHVNNIYAKLSVKNRVEARLKYEEMTAKERGL